MVMYQEFVGNDLYYGAMATNFLVILDYTSGQMFIGNLCISYYPMDLICVILINDKLCSYKIWTPTVRRM